MQKNNVDGQLSLFGPGFSDGRTFSEHSRQATHPERISESSSKKLSELSAVPYMSLDLTPGSGDLLGRYSWEILSPSHLGFSTRNTGVSPREGSACSLSQILQEQVPRKYYLSRRACRGILRRADERNKPLPPELKWALEMQAGIYDKNKNMPPGESPKVYCLNDQGGQRMDWSLDLSGTLLAQDSHAPVVYENHGIDGRCTGPHSVVPTMSARWGTGGNNIPLVAQPEVICIAGNIIDRKPKNGGNGMGFQKDLAYTLTTADRHAVFCRQRVDVFRRSDIASTQSARQYKDATDLVLQEGEGPACLLIRRLVPRECELLQGYPPGWTELPGASDSARYKALGNSVPVPCVEYIMHGIALVLRSGQ